MMNPTCKTALALALAALSCTSFAADWSDTAISVRYGTKFAEPYNNNPDGSRNDITKTIVGLTHVSGYKYGVNFFNADLLLSDRNDPGDGTPGASGAQEVYIVYRHLLDFGKVMSKDLKVGPVRGFGFTAGFDWNTKNDGYASKKRMFVFGPTVMFDVPGFANLSLLAFKESNSPKGIADRYTYDTHPALAAEWGIPIGSLPLAFEGYALYIGDKGTNEFGGPTKPETHIDMKLMLDVGVLAGGPKGTFKVGLAYEYWKNKFGNPTETPGAGDGATARTPMIRAEYHF
ncbi:outer envelope protein [Methylibium sp. Root1272]|nr:outer envelope protein [Methylibium sp. Root1272]